MSSPEPRQFPPSARNAFPAWGAAAVLAVAMGFFLWLRLVPGCLPEPDRPGLLSDPDGAMFAAILGEARRQGAWHIAMFPHDNAPFGRPVAWSAANTTALRVVEAALGYRWARTLFGSVLGLAALATLGVMAWRGGERGLALLWAAAWAGVPGLVAMQLAGNLDHHSLQTGALAVALGGLLLGVGEPSRMRGVVAGTGLGLMLWAGATEALPFLAMVAVLVLMEWPQGQAHRFWRDAWLAGVAIIAVPLVLGDWSLVLFDRLHPIHAVLWAGAGLAGVWVGRRPGGWPERAIGLLILVAGLALALALAAGIAGGLRGVSAVLRPEFARHAEQVAEFQPLASGPLELVRGWLWNLGGLALLPLAAARWGEGRVRTLALWAAAVMTMYLVGTAVGARWMRPASAVAVVAGCWALGKLPLGAVAKGWLLAGAMALPLGSAVELRLGGNPVARRSAECHRAAREAAEVLGGARPVVLCGLDVAPFLLAEEGAATIGSLYHENIAGLDAHALLFTARARGDFDPVAAERKVAAVLVLGRGDLVNDIARALVQRGRREPTVADVEATVVWRLYADPRSDRTRLPSGAELLWLSEPRQAIP